MGAGCSCQLWPRWDEPGESQLVAWDEAEKQRLAEGQAWKQISSGHSILIRPPSDGHNRPGRLFQGLALESRP